MERIIEYVYEVNNDIVRTYHLVEEDRELYLRKISNFYLALRGDATIYDLRNRGYIEMSEAKEKYNVDSFERREKEKYNVDSFERREKEKVKTHLLRKLAKRR